MYQLCKTKTRFLFSCTVLCWPSSIVTNAYLTRVSKTWGVLWRQRTHTSPLVLLCIALYVTCTGYWTSVARVKVKSSVCVITCWSSHAAERDTMLEQIHKVVYMTWIHQERQWESIILHMSTLGLEDSPWPQDSGRISCHSSAAVLAGNVLHSHRLPFIDNSL